MTIIVETKRLILREFTLADAAELNKTLADPEVMRFSLSGPMNVAQTKEFLDKRVISSYNQRGYGLYAAVLKPTNNIIGYCGFFPQTVDGQYCVEIGYRLMRQHWGKGYATEAAIAMRDYAFNVLKLDYVISIIEAANVASIRVAEKVGMQHEKDTKMYNIPVRIYSLKKT